MNKDLKKELQRIAKPPRPRPLMYVGKHNGKKCYIRKKDLSYFQLRDKLQLRKPWWHVGKYIHIFQKKHPLSPKWSGGFGR